VFEDFHEADMLRRVTGWDVIADELRGTARRIVYSPRTGDAYVSWIRRYILFHHKRHPKDMSEPEVSAFLTALATTGHVSASTQNQALSALLFLNGAVLGRNLDALSEVVRARRPVRLPVVLSRDEVRAILARLDGSVGLMASLMYGAGLRLLECAELRVKDVDLPRVRSECVTARAARIESPCFRGRSSTG
jgi:integrase